jgi:glycosyltransferase involved in cell wall biosynthesis
MSDFYPLVTIVIPVYNGANFMRYAIDGALDQDYDNIEVVVVNDGSTDTTGEIAKSYGDKIRYFIKENGGVSSALNMGIKNARGMYISWCSHDEFYLPNKISTQVEKLKEFDSKENLIPNCEYTHFDIVDNTDRNGSIRLTDDISLFPPNKIDSLKSLYLGHCDFCCLLIPKAAFDLVGYFDENLCATQDYHFCFRLIDAGYMFVYIPDKLVVDIRHEGQSTHRIKKDILKREHNDLWLFANKLFINEIKKAPKKDKKIFYSRDYRILRNSSTIT